jgi:uncharacterized protein YciI
MHYLLLYQFVPDYLERRGKYRDEHLRVAWEAQARGELLLGGAFAEPADGAALVFTADSIGVAKRFAEADPYVRAGLVTHWQVRPWTTVVGEAASNPALPS